MLVFNLEVAEKMRIGNDIEVKVLDVAGRNIRLGFIAPSDVNVHREEVYLKIKTQQIGGHSSASGSE